MPLWFVQREVARAEEAPAVNKSPNERPRIALIGAGGQGTNDTVDVQRFGDVVAVCDVDKNHLDAAVARFSKEGKVPARFTDFRKLLERDEVDAVINGTPDHWHSLVNIAAARAKKDIYSEKPLTLTVDEGPACDQSRARQQGGLANRHPTYAAASAFVRSTPDDSPFGANVKPDGQRNGIRFEGYDGWIWVNRDEIKASERGLLTAPLPEGSDRLYFSNDHKGNFFDCMKTREDPICTVETGHRSATVCHLGANQLRTGKILKATATPEKAGGRGLGIHGLGDTSFGNGIIRGAVSCISRVATLMPLGQDCWQGWDPFRRSKPGRLPSGQLQLWSLRPKQSQ